MLLISWPSTAVSTKRPSRSAYGPELADDRRRARRRGVAAAPVSRHRGRERDHPADEHHRRPRDAAVGLLDRQHAGRRRSPRRRAARRPPAGTAPVASRTTIAAEHDERPLRARPERHRLAADDAAGWSTTSTSGSSSCSSSAPHVPWSSSVSPTASTVVAGQLLALALHGEHDEVAALGHHARERRVADRAPSAAGSRPRRRPSAASGASRVALEPVLLDQRACMLAEVRGSRCAALRSRQQPLAEEHDDQRSSRRRAGRRRARTRSSRSCPRPPRARTPRRSRSPASPSASSSEPAWAAKASGSSSWLGERRSRTAITTTTGSSAATAPFTLISAVTAATSSISTRAAACGSRRRARSAAARPRR